MSGSHRTDYDKVAADYDDDPKRRKDVDAYLRSFVEEREPASAEWSALDVGCGTGNQHLANRQAFPLARLVGLDPSPGMLHRARSKTTDVDWVRGDGCRLPFANESIDYVSNQFAYPHVSDREALIREIFRVLKPKGRFVLVNIAPWMSRGWIYYRFFPVAWVRDEQDFLPNDRLEELMHEAGFANVETTVTPRIWQENLQDFFRVARQRTGSQLTTISDEAYQAGLEAIEKVIEEDARPDRTVDSELTLVTILADKA